jgi:hypothetical protein
MLDEQLRQELADWAQSAGRLPVPGVGQLRRRIRGRRLRAAAASAGPVAGAAVALILVLLSSPAPNVIVPVSGGHQGRTAPAYPTAWYPAGPLPPADAGPQAAPYFVTIRFQLQRPDAEVVDWASGRVMDVVQPPPSAGDAGFQAVAAAGDDRMFVLAADAGRTGASPGSSTCVFYELRLAGNGRLRTLTRLPVPPVRLSAPGAFAISADGRQLAVVQQLAGRPDLEVVQLATGRVRKWTTTHAGNVVTLAWAGPHQLAFSWEPASRTYNLAGVGLRLLDLGAPGHDLLAAPLIISAASGFGEAASEPVVSASGAAIFATLSADGGSQAEIMQYSAAGQRVGTVMTVTESGIGAWCGALWSDPAGSEVAAVCGTAEGTVTGGRLQPRDLHVPGYEEGVPEAAFIAW